MSWFSPKLAASLDSPFSGREPFLALELVPGVLGGVAGRVQYPPPVGVTQLAPPVAGDVLDLSFPSPSTGFALARQNVLMRTDDAGGSWHLLDASLVNYFKKADGKVAHFPRELPAVEVPDGETWQRLDRRMRKLLRVR